MERKESLYERAKYVQEDFYEIANSLEFIRRAAENDGDSDLKSQYNHFLVADMIKGLRFFVKNSGEEIFQNLGIEEPKESTDPEDPTE